MGRAKLPRLVGIYSRERGTFGKDHDEIKVDCPYCNVPHFFQDNSEPKIVPCMEPTSPYRATGFVIIHKDLDEDGRERVWKRVLTTIRRPYTPAPREAFREPVDCLVALWKMIGRDGQASISELNADLAIRVESMVKLADLVQRHSGGTKDESA